MRVAVFESNAVLRQAAADFAAIIQQEVSAQGEVDVIFATGNSQLSFLHALRGVSELPSERLIAFHMDEYLGIAQDHPASFRRFIREKISDTFHPRATYGIDGNAADIEGKLARYAALLEARQPAVRVLGIGENGHLAFNDPPTDFHMPKTNHLVTHDEKCRSPAGRGGTLSSHRLGSTTHYFTDDTSFAEVGARPGARAGSAKATLVQAALEGPVTENCPASI